MRNGDEVQGWLSDLEFERFGTVRRLLKKVLINPLANYMPAGLMRAVLRLTESELAAANWADPGGWRSMVISYDGNPRQIADKLLVHGGAMPMALRNRRRLAARLLARLIERAPVEPAHVLSLGAGPGIITTDALAQARRKAYATLVDLNADAFEYGREYARRAGAGNRVRFLAGDIRTHIHEMLDHPPDVVEMLGICEYLTDEQVVSIASAVNRVMAGGAPALFNSLSMAHGNDRFFRRVFGLHMNHRSARELQALMGQAGFGDFLSIPEPLGVYHVIIGRKGG